MVKQNEGLPKEAAPITDKDRAEFSARKDVKIFYPLTSNASFMVYCPWGMFCRKTIKEAIDTAIRAMEGQY